MSRGLPDPPAEPAADQSLDLLAPKFRALVESVLLRMHALGYDAVIAEAFRSDERQAWLYGFGREYDDGRGVVTNASTGATSWHRYGLAVDIIDRTRGWNAGESFWRTLGQCAAREGLAWGGAWPRFPDKPHVQFGAPMRQSPSSRAVELLASGGVEAVWKEVGAV